MTLGEVAEAIRSSIHTARRRLRQWRASHSHNRNGRYYALPDVPEFDGDGLWRWRGAFFSRHGNLRQTVVALVERSPAGLDAGELGTLIATPCAGWESTKGPSGSRPRVSGPGPSPGRARCTKH